VDRPVPAPEPVGPPAPYIPAPGETPLPLLGSVIVASDNTYLGVISTDPNDPDSVANPNGQFGDPTSPDSIWNPDGRFGSQSQDDSPWCDWATRPPQLFLDGRFRGYLSTNELVYPRIDPYWLANYLGAPSE
jgi:hypothetical protein